MATELQAKLTDQDFINITNYDLTKRSRQHVSMRSLIMASPKKLY